MMMTSSGLVVRSVLERPWFGGGRVGLVWMMAALAAWVGATQPARGGDGPSPTAPAARDGLAVRHPGDRGLESDKAVLFFDDFETGDLSRWQDLRRPIEVVRDAPHSGEHCAHLPMTRDKDNGGEAKVWFMPGADWVFTRFYIKFSEDYQYNHHFVTLMANRADNRWSAFGKAGLKPDGTYFSSGMEPAFAWGANPPPGEVNLYSYFLDMKIDPKMNKYWGNAFYPPGPDPGRPAGSKRVIPPLGRWQCWEFMVEANSAPNLADGRQAMWIDGEPIAVFTGIRWRDDPDLKINCLWLQHYGYDEGDPTRRYHKERQAVWFDDVVVATEYIGPKVTVPEGTNSTRRSK